MPLTNQLERKKDAQNLCYLFPRKITPNVKIFLKFNMCRYIILEIYQPPIFSIIFNLFIYDVFDIDNVYLTLGLSGSHV